MIEKALERVNARRAVKVTVKGAVALLAVALAVGLPQIVHIAAGAAGGAKWLPMYLPVLLGGSILGVWWGLGIGVAAPVVSFLVTLAAGNAMPAAARLPYMAAELAVYGAVSGLFTKQIEKTAWAAFPAAIIASVAGRTVYLTIAAMAGGWAAALAQVQTGLFALVLQSVIVPAIVIAVRCALCKETRERDE